MEKAAADSGLLAALQDGLPLVPRPFGAIAERAGMPEEEVLRKVSDWKRSGLIRRFGVVVQHRKLGYTANAMCVWDLPEARAREIGDRMAREPGVTLCYRRRRTAVWPFNLYCMIHGKDRESVDALRAGIVERLGLGGSPHRVLFSSRCFKQRGARYRGRPSGDAELLNALQAGLPVVERPFEDISARHGLTEGELLRKIENWLADGTLSRFGPMYNVERMGGAFVLAALSAPGGRFEEVTALVNSYPEVAHNYEREHAYNMWFVVAAETPVRAQAVLDEIAARTGLKVIALPKLEEYYLNLQLEVR